MRKFFSVFLAGIMLAVMGLGVTACKWNRQFYTLLEAYNEGLITDADLGAINAYEGESVTFTEESREMFRAQLLEHFDDLKGTLYYTYYTEGEEDIYPYLKEDMYPLLKDALKNNVHYPKIIQYYGEYGGASVLYVELLYNMFMISCEYYVGEYKFFTWLYSFYLVWTNPEEMEFSLREVEG